MYETKSQRAMFLSQGEVEYQAIATNISAKFTNPQKNLSFFFHSDHNVCSTVSSQCSGHSNRRYVNYY